MLCVPAMRRRTAALLAATIFAPVSVAAELPREIAGPIWYAAIARPGDDARRAEGELAVAVVNALTLRPELAEEIMAVAAVAAPDLQSGLTERIARFRPTGHARADADTNPPPTAVPPDAGPALAQAVPGLAQAAPRTTRPPPPGDIVSGPGTIQPLFPPLVPEAPPAPAAGFPTDGGEIGDPLEGLNRFVFAVNDAFDTLLLRPAAWAYGEITPAFVKRAFGNFFRNLNSPVILANDLLQFELEEAATTTGRFLVNSTIGVLGLLEVAEDMGMPRHQADFGQTLYSWGVGFGPYLVLPLLGPSSARDATGTAADSMMNPLSYVLDAPPRIVLAATQAVVRREPLIGPLDDIKATSLDYYVALRSSWYQNRQLTLRRGAAGQGGGTDSSATDALFDAAE